MSMLCPPAAATSKGALYVGLTLDLGEIRQRGAPALRPRRGGGLDLLQAAEIVQQLPHARHGVDLQLRGEGRLRRIVRGDEEPLYPRPLCGKGHGQRAAHGPELPGQGELAYEGAVGRRLLYFAGGGKDAEQDRQIVDRAALLGVGRREIHGEAGDGELQPGVAYGGPDPVARLAHGGIGQPDDLELRQALGERALDGHLIAADALYSQRANTRDHGRTPLVYFPNAVSAMARTASIMKLMSSPAVTLGKPWAK